ncbi:MAG: hypothetical protein AB8G14_01640 [Ilumatobacter sp.]
MEIYIVVGTIGFVIFMSLVSRRLLSRMVNGSKKKQEMAAELMRTGIKARAQIVGLTPTGTVVNEIYIRTVVRFEIQPLDGATKFDGEKKMLINQTTQPRIGDVWPCWFDRSDRSIFAVGQPAGDARDNIEVFREFGIPHPLDS